MPVTPARGSSRQQLRQSQQVARGGFAATPDALNQSAMMDISFEAVGEAKATMAAPPRTSARKKNTTTAARGTIAPASSRKSNQPFTPMEVVAELSSAPSPVPPIRLEEKEPGSSSTAGTVGASSAEQEEQRNNKKKQEQTPTMLRPSKRVRIAKDDSTAKKPPAHAGATAGKATSPVEGRKLQFAPGQAGDVLLQGIELDLTNVQSLDALGKIETRIRDAGVDSRTETGMRILHLVKHVRNRFRSAQSSADQLKDRAKDLYDSGNFAQAEQAYAECIRLDPTQSVFFGNYAATLMMLGRFREAIASCERAIALDASVPKYHMRCARAHLSLGDATSCLGRLSRFTSTAFPDPSVVRDAFDLSRQASLYLDKVNQGDECLRREDFVQARAFALDAVQIAPASVRARCLRITARAMENVLSGGGNPFSRAVLDDCLGDLATNVGAAGCNEVMWYGKILWNCALRVEAAAFFTLVHGWAPGDKRAENFLHLAQKMEQLWAQANKLQREARYGEAIRAYDDALALDPLNDSINGRILFSRAALCLLLNQPLECELDCLRALRKIPTYFRARILRSKALVMLGRLSEAETEIRAVETQYSTRPAFLSYAHEVTRVWDLLRAASANVNPNSHNKRRAQPEEERNKENHPSKNGGGKAKHANTSGQDDAKRTRMKSYSSSSSMAETHYTVLGVNAHATREEIRKAYKVAALRLHPDKNPNNPLASQQFQRLAEAFHVVSSPTKKRMYDLTLV